ncbi:hypothetical protein ACI2L1_10180 [Streptomyces sp. NPDC019531]
MGRSSGSVVGLTPEPSLQTAVVVWGVVGVRAREALYVSYNGRPGEFLSG